MKYFKAVNNENNIYISNMQQNDRLNEENFKTFMIFIKTHIKEIKCLTVRVFHSNDFPRLMDMFEHLEHLQVNVYILYKK